MNKQELIKKFENEGRALEKQVDTMLAITEEDIYLKAYTIGRSVAFLVCAEVAKELDEPKAEECELIEDRDDWECLESLTCSICNHNVYDNNWRYFNFCPNCGRKINKKNEYLINKC